MSFFFWALFSWYCSLALPTFLSLLGEAQGGAGDSGNSSGSLLSWMAATVAFCCLGGILMVGFLGACLFFLAIEYIGI